VQYSSRLGFQKKKDAADLKCIFFILYHLLVVGNP